MTYETVHLVGKYLNAVTGEPGQGYLLITPTTPRIVTGSSEQLFAASMDSTSGGVGQITLDENGAFDVSLPASDDPTFLPQGFAYRVLVKLKTNITIGPWVVQVNKADAQQVEVKDSSGEVIETRWVVNIARLPAITPDITDYTGTLAALADIRSAVFGYVFHDAVAGAITLRGTGLHEVSLAADAEISLTGTPGESVVIDAELNGHSLIVAGQTIETDGFIELRRGRNGWRPAASFEATALSVVADVANPGYFRNAKADPANPGYFLSVGFVPDPSYPGYFL